MAIDVGKTSGTGAQTPAPANPKSQLGKADFMKLLVAQLKNQDPLNPVDSKEMIAQLATLTSVEKLTSLDQTMLQMRAESAGMATMQATSLIGKRVAADSSHLRLEGTSPATAQFALEGAAKTVTVTVRDLAGHTVRTFELGATAAGNHAFSWDGLNDAGRPAAPGIYDFEVAAKAENGQPVTASTQVSGVVSEVAFDNGVAELVVGEARVSLRDVISVLQ